MSSKKSKSKIASICGEEETLFNSMIDYPTFCNALQGKRLPAAIVSLEDFYENLKRVINAVTGTNKTVRVASKSIRSPYLLKTLFENGKGKLKGIMSFSMEEAELLTESGLDDIIVAYPTVQKSDLKIFSNLLKRGCNISLVVDEREHLEMLSDWGKSSDTVMRVALEIDMSYKPFGEKVHIGVRRSPLRRVDDVNELFKLGEKLSNIKIVGILAYEAQVAGMTDSNPFTPLLNPVKKFLKRLSIDDVAERRESISSFILKNGIELEFFNGGGTGSLNSTAKEKCVTEITVGSGFFCPHLFDYYKKISFVPAAFFALQVVRRPAPNIVTCHGGGYAASGEAGIDRLPIPFLPEGCRLINFEGAGEVQTPVIIPDNVKLKPGDPIIFRHAKAGELGERFNEYLLLENGEIKEAVPTYRGIGKSFL